MKQILFKYNNTIIADIMDDLTISEIEKWREVIAYECETTIDKIVITYIDKYHSDFISNIQIDDNGKLVYSDLKDKEITGVRIGSDLSIERNLNMFLDRIMENNVDEVIFFTI